MSLIGIRRNLAGLVIAVVSVLSAEAVGALDMPAIFGDGMMLQRDMRVPIWGTASPGARIEVQFGDQRKIAMAGDDGRWTVRLDEIAAGPDHATELVITSGDGSVTFSDVEVGDVWICGGQSNMEWPVRRSDNAIEEIASADFPEIWFC